MGRAEKEALDTATKELRAPMKGMRHLFMMAGLFSLVVNLLMLTGPLFMLQVYDRVLASGSVSTLVALSVLATVLFISMGLLDHLRSRILARVGARYQESLDARVFDAGLSRATLPMERSRPLTALRDLEAIQRLLAGPAPLAFFDAPWTPIYLAIIYLFHPYMGYLAFAAIILMVILTIANEASSRTAHEEASKEQASADAILQSVRRDAETAAALGMRQTLIDRWQQIRQRATGSRMRASDRSGGFSATSKTMRFYLQSAMLGLGAYLVLQGEITAGVMIAASIVMGRTLAPVEQAIGQWSTVQRAREAWGSLKEVLMASPPRPARVALPALSGAVVAKDLQVAPPGSQRPTVEGLDFDVQPGQALGIIGPSGAGKSTLARVLAGIWPEHAGSLRLGGATVNQWEPDDLGRQIGYVGQESALFDGTVFENVSRFVPEPDSEAVIAAVRQAGALEMIMNLPDGFNTPVGTGGSMLSGGQRQRIALARALYGDPHLYIFDEPNANLDAQGEQALTGAIADLKKRGKIVIIVAHRPAAIMLCDKLVMIQNGRQRMFGNRDEVLRHTVQGFPRAVPPATAGVTP